MKFYKRDPDRAIAGMAELTLKQRGAYNSLLDLLYSRDGNVPDDDARVARMISCHWREWATIKAELIVIGKVWVEDGMLHAKRVQDTIKEASNFSQEQSKRASRRWQEPGKINEINEPPMPHGNASTPIATPTAIATEESKTHISKIGDNSVGSVSMKPELRTRGTRLSKDWVLPNSWGQWALEQFPHLDRETVLAIADEFKDYWIAVPGQKGCKIEWEATWRNRVRDKASRSQPSKGSQKTPPSGMFSKLAEFYDAKAEREEAGSGESGALFPDVPKLAHHRA